MTNSAPLPPPSPAESTPAAGWRWAAPWVLAFVALWPAPGYAEAVMVLGARAAIGRLLVGRFRGGMRLQFDAQFFEQLGAVLAVRIAFGNALE